MHCIYPFCKSHFISNSSDSEVSSKNCRDITIVLCDCFLSGEWAGKAWYNCQISFLKARFYSLNQSISSFIIQYVINFDDSVQLDSWDNKWMSWLSFELPIQIQWANVFFMAQRYLLCAQQMFTFFNLCHKDLIHNGFSSSNTTATSSYNRPKFAEWNKMDEHPSSLQIKYIMKLKVIILFK